MSRRIVSGAALGAVVCALFSFGGGCLTRPVDPGNPSTKTNFTNQVNETSISKVDLLFDIDNSASMGDKQAYLAAAIPDLITRLVQPNCLDMNGNIVTQSDSMGMGTCTSGTVEFPPVHDMHIGIVSSSLGTRGGDTGTCNPTQTQPIAGGGTIPKHNDDRGELLNRSSTLTGTTVSNVESPEAAAGQNNFLAWYPTATANPANGLSPGAVATTSAGNLKTEFTNMVQGVHQYGCGIESQLESWYRFLIQPDPYDSISSNNLAGPATWVGVDKTIIQQRHDFLRPDSLVVVIVLTDENDSEIDVRSFSGTGYEFMNQGWQPPMANSTCATNPGSSSCTKTNNTYPQDQTSWGYNLNLRHVHMKQKYGASPQFPIQRYVLGLTSARVPNRTGEYPTTNSGYEGLNNLNCVNPLFGILPDGSDLSANALCNLMPDTSRQPANNLVYYAHIGGVPHQLLQVDPTNPDSPQKDTLSDADWVKILGTDPENYDYTGIDPHMVEAYQPRTASGVLPSGVNGNSLSPPGSPVTADPINGHEWITDGKDTNNQPVHVNLPVDREYACIFKLQDAKGTATPRNCDPSAAPAMADPTILDACDCSSPMLSADQVPAVCNSGNPLQQDYAKAYPTIRELDVARLLKNQGIVSSLCPIHLSDNAAGNDPLYGYRPAIKAIVDRLSAALQHQCLPQKLTPDDDAGDVPCLVLVTLTDPSATKSSCTDATDYPSLIPVPGDVLSRFQADQHAAFLAGGTQDLSLLPTCEVQQVLPKDFVSGSCAASTNAQGWCYVENAKGCDQAIYFSPKGLPPGAQVSLQCLETSSELSSSATSSSSSGGSSTGDDASTSGD